MTARRLLDALAPSPADPEWELAAQSVAVKIRWFGLVVGVLLANFGADAAGRRPLNAILLLGLGFTAADTFFFLRRRVFLNDYPVAVSALEALFIGLLCYFESGPDSPYRFYYLLSLICCAIRHNPITTFVTCGFDGVSFAALYVAQPADKQDVRLALLMIVVLVWVAWAGGAMARLLKRGGERLRDLNRELRRNQSELETRIADRTRELQESQAQVLHQEKMAGFGLLAAGIAHEVGNPLTSISTVLQMLERRDHDDYTRDRLGQVSGQLLRIQSILRELVVFSRPASGQTGRVAVRDVIDEALGIAKYYKGGKNRVLTADVPAGLPAIIGVRDQLVQVIFNLVLNAIDATGKGGHIAVTAAAVPGAVVLAVADDGTGIPDAAREKLFRPYFTTKKHGTGLGLFVIQKIVAEHGGAVELDPPAGVGATFRVTLPTPPGAAECPPPAS